MARIINELSQAVVTVTPFDVNNDPYTPISARYRVDDCTSETEMVGWTAITSLSTSMEVIIPGSVNTIVNDRHKKETKVVTVNTDSGLDTEHNEDYKYDVKNLAFVT